MRRIGWTAAGAVLGALLVAGCGPAGSGEGPARAAGASAGAKPSAGAFGKAQAAADLTAATAAAGLSQPEASATATATAAPSAEQDERRAELLACMAPWQSMQRVDEPGKAYEATVAALQQRGWTAGSRDQQDMLTQTTLKKQGWVLLARRYDFSRGKGSATGMPDMLSFFASDEACASRFTDAEFEEALKDGPGGGY